MEKMPLFSKLLSNLQLRKQAENRNSPEEQGEVKLHPLNQSLNAEKIREKFGDYPPAFNQDGLPRIHDRNREVLDEVTNEFVRMDVYGVRHYPKTLHQGIPGTMMMEAGSSILESSNDGNTMLGRADAAAPRPSGETRVDYSSKFKEEREAVKGALKMNYAMSGSARAFKSGNV